MYHYSRKGQAQIHESTIVLIVFFILLIMGIALFYRYNMKSIETNKLNFERDRTYTLLPTLPNSPLLQKSKFLDEESAIDTTKIIGLKLEDAGYDNLGFKSIAVKEVYPRKAEGICSAKSYPNCDTYLLYDNKPKKEGSRMEISTPVSLYFPFTDSYGAGRLEITWWVN